MIFSLNASIDADFYNEWDCNKSINRIYFCFYRLKKDAEVVLDDGRRIVKYRKNGGGLSLLRKIVRQTPLFRIPNTHFSSQCKNAKPKEKTKKSWVFWQRNQTSLTRLSLLFRSWETSKRKLKARSRWVHWKQGIHKTFLCISKAIFRYRCSKNKIYWSPHYDQATKLKMMFISGAKVPECFLKQ